MTAVTALPPLREELSLHRGGRLDTGEPTWVIQDPTANRYFRLGWFEFEVLSRWSLGSSAAIAESIERETVLQSDAEQVDDVIRFLSTHNLLQVRGEQAIKRMLQQYQSTRKGALSWLLKNYLFVRVPLLHPERLLQRCYPAVSKLWGAPSIIVLSLMLLAGLFLVGRQWDSFLATFPHMFSLEGAIMVGLALSLSKILHEFGHAFTAKRFGCSVPSMGVAFLVMWPVLYTDASDAWRLTARRQRLAIAAAGMVVELALAIIATFAWSFMEDGPMRTAVFMLATTTWIVTLLVNLNPFMRFDGYYLLSDWLDMPNLQDRAFALGRWRMRETLFGWGEPPPENFPRSRARLLIAYAWGTWVYRFFLFLGIALLVYFLFFKMLGIFLMIVELAWFIGKPAWNELKHWLDRREAMRMNLQAMRTLGIVVALIALAVFPWRGSVTAPALYQASDHAQLYVPQAAQVIELTVQPGQAVRKGEVLLMLSSPDLEHEIAQAQRRVENLRWQIEFAAVNPFLRERVQVLRRELDTEQATLDSSLAERARLTMASPIDGVITDSLVTLAEGNWLSEGEWLFTIVAPQGGYLAAYVSESDLAALEQGADARFYPNDISRSSFQAVVTDIAPVSTRILPEAPLASTQGGAIAVRATASGDLIPEQTLYRVTLQPVQAGAAPVQTIVGTVNMQGQRRSWLLYKLRQAYAVMIRESGF